MIIELKADKISIDMVDIILEINVFDFNQQIKPILDKKLFLDEIEYYTSFKWNGYRHNFKYKDKEEKYSFFFAYQHNIEDIRERFYLSYNPNKVDPDDDLLTTLIRFILNNMEDAAISKFDVAFDYVGLKSSDLIIDKGRKRRVATLKYPDSDITYYFGDSGSNGAVKIYDKASEECKEDLSKKQGEKTRIEYTVKDKIPLVLYEGYKTNIELCNFNLRGVLGLYDDTELTDFDKMLVYSIENGYPVEKLSYRNRKKYKEIFASKKEVYTELKPSQLDIEKAIKKYIEQLLIDYNCIEILKEKQFKKFIKEVMPIKSII